MKRHISRRWAMGTFAASCATLALPLQAIFASRSAVRMRHWRGTITYVPDGPSPFTMEGTASHLGQFAAVGEVSLLPVDESGLMIGAGVVVFTSANGDLLVGNTEWVVNGEEISEIRFRWQDSVEFGNETVFANTGRFVSDRPPGLIIDARVIILAGILASILNPNNYK